MDDEEERERERNKWASYRQTSVLERHYRLLWNVKALMLATVLAAGCPGPLMLRRTTLAGAGRPASGQTKW